MFSRPDGLMLYGKFAVGFFSSSELLCPNMKKRLQLIRVRPNFYVITDNSNVSFGIVDCSIPTLKDFYHQKRKDVLAYTPVEFDCLENVVKIFIIPTTQIQFIQECIFSNNPVRRIDIAKNTNSAFTGSYPKNPFWW